MSIDSKLMSEYISSIACERSPEEVERSVAIFMCRCLETVRELLPEFGQAALDLADSYWLENKGELSMLYAARESCWNYLESDGPSMYARDEEGAIIRALLCVLRSGYSVEDSIDSLRWFSDMFERLGSRNSEGFNEELKSMAKAKL